jgi:molybdopterin-binding protein
MSYIILELHGGAEYASIVTDENGNNLVFEIREEAEAEATDCQDGLIVEL